MSSERKAEAPYIHRGRPHLHGRLMQRTPRRCMVRVRGGEAYLQVPAAHPIRARLVMGQWEQRSEEHTSELQSLMRISYAVFCLKKKKVTQSTMTSSQVNN